MKHYAYLKQEGDGCDYTIGCGRIMINFEADNPDHAKEVLKKTITEEYNDNYKIEEALLFTSEPISIDVDSIYAEAETQCILEKAKEQEKHDRAQYKKLKKQFDKTSD